MCLIRTLISDFENPIDFFVDSTHKCFYIGKPKWIHSPMNTDTCISAFEKCLIPLARRESRETRGVLLHGDNARPHTSKKSCRWFDGCGFKRVGFGGFPLYEKGGHPPNSPDLNPIELLFVTVQERVSKQNPRTVFELMKVCQKEWRNISQDEVRKVFERYPKVLRQLRNSNFDLYE